MIRETVLHFGGLDIFVNNAGIVRAGSLEEMTKSNFELVTAVNYTAYFLCVKYASAVMKLQHTAAPSKLFDIIEINSKSGLAGSNKNFAYAGSKFGGIGLTQSFAMELAPYNIKVNARSAPETSLKVPSGQIPKKGFFVQYLRQERSLVRRRPPMPGNFTQSRRIPEAAAALSICRKSDFLYLRTGLRDRSGNPRDRRSGNAQIIRSDSKNSQSGKAPAVFLPDIRVRESPTPS